MTGTHDPARPKCATARAYLAAAAAVVLYQAITLISGLSRAPQGKLLDEDGYLYLVRAQSLHDGGGWYDVRLMRANTPDGFEPHWARPFDTMLLLGGWAGALLGGFERALFWWAACVLAALQVLTALALVWAAAPLLEGAALLLGLLLVTRSASGFYALVGKTDHHGLLLLGNALGLGLTLRLLGSHFDRRSGLAAGAASGFGMWLAIELLLPMAATPAALAVAWATRGGDRALGDGLARPSLARCADGRLVVLDEAAHSLRHEEPELVNRLLCEHLAGP